MRLTTCSKIGPAAARNLGSKMAEADWILFTDSDCCFSESTMLGYIQNQNNSIGYCGSVMSNKQDLFSKYYNKHDLLIPREDPNKLEKVPNYIITANCLLWKEAIFSVDGFNETILIAACEDIELGVKLSQSGRLSYSLDSIIYHDYGDGLSPFFHRFYRYGKGVRLLKEMNMVDINALEIFSINHEKIKLSFVEYFLELVRNIATGIGYFYRK